MLLLLALHTPLAVEPARDLSARDLLARLDTGFIPESLRVSPDQRRAAWVSLVEDGMRVIVDGRVGPTYHNVAVGTPVFSPDSRHVAYLAEDDEGWHLVVDDRKGPATAGFLEGSLSFGADDGRVAVAVRALDYWWQPAIGAIGAPDGPPEVTEDADLFDALATPMHVGPKGDLRFAARKDHRWFVVQGGVRSPSWDQVEATVMGPEGERFAYVANQDHRAFAVVDGQPGAPFEDIAAEYLTFSPDGTRVAYPARRDGAWWVVESDPAEPVLHGAWQRMAGGLVFSADGLHLGWLASDGQAWVVIVDGQPHGRYPAVLEDSLALAPDGSRAAWAVPTPSGATVMVDGVPMGPTWSELTHPPVFSPDGEHVVWGARMGDQHSVVLDGEAGPAYGAVMTLGDAHLEWLDAARFQYLVLDGDGLYRVEEALSAPKSGAPAMP